ncbi:antigen 5 like allergen Cul n 1-like [Zeugodacus cucurbitae]|uniref:antigen 5 like allergen Cul n 1-like n=1 Tax=Zeugodacus cucurbitae TaxID=28588 RepID=UPI0023D911FB|nr:antigen 5 like allergen Cul n 1-like [Zeugodacus cucurbitae]
MELKFVLIAAFIGALQIVHAKDYCDSSYCGSRKHIACDNNGKFAASCKNPAMITFTQTQKDLIVDSHNNKRNTVAGGKTKLKPACRMATMQWDNELAELAALNVKQCQMKHDACRNTDAFKYSGQNLAWITFYNTPNATKLSLQSVDMWYDEIDDTKMEYINKYPNNYQGPAIGHFTVMMADRNIRVGCAASTYDESGQPYKAFLFACNYATTNMINFPIYKSCSVAASECKAGKNPKYTSLCSVSEKYDVNKWF